MDFVWSWLAGPAEEPQPRFLWQVEPRLGPILADICCHIEVDEANNEVSARQVCVEDGHDVFVEVEA